MGLIGGVLGTLFCGGSATLLSPVAFLQRPFRWLQTIAQTGASISGGPNFAYELCARKITREQRDELDLSCWKLAFNGAEPIRADTLERFAETFASCGFRREAMYPCYGLAEATLMVSGSGVGVPPVVRSFDIASLESNAVVASDTDGYRLVSSGRPLSGHQVVIVDPQTNSICPSNRVGEIWVASPSVAQGYWKRGADSERTFGARLADTGEGPFLRTGDLGFLHEGELFVTGRLKDLIIIRGRNYYPQDIEWTVQQSHPALRADACAVFAIEGDGEEKLVIVQELDRAHRSANVEEVMSAIRQAVSRQHELNVHAIRLLKPMSIPKTSSGKIQRHACRQGFLAGTLDELGAWTQEADQAPVAETSDGELLNQLEEAPTSYRRDLLLTFLQEAAGDALGLPRTQPIDPAQPLRDLGFDSLAAVNVCNRVGLALGRTLPATLLFDFPTLDELATHLDSEQFSSESPIPEIGRELDAVVEQIEGLTEEELDAILREEAGCVSKVQEVC
jgi:acyl-CoA synthetase (AMP-forming)/AMP-acid ligase II/acyl carrier protein